MVKTLSAHLKGKNPKCPLQWSKPKYAPQKSQPKLPTLKVKTLSAHLNGQNPKCLHLKYPPQKSQTLKCPP